jgi:hypothetical protein
VGLEYKQLRKFDYVVENGRGSVCNLVQEGKQLEHMELWPILEKTMRSLWLRTSDNHWVLYKSISQNVDVVVMMYQHIGFNVYEGARRENIESKHEDASTKAARKRSDNASKNWEPSPEVS